MTTHRPMNEHRTPDGAATQVAASQDWSHKWTIAIDGRRLREARLQRGLSQEDLADRARVSVTTVARLERHQGLLCRSWTLGRLAAALNEEPAALKADRQGNGESSGLAGATREA
jgi:ribosome-binding protein aMBF1 (putative translation factor)